MTKTKKNKSKHTIANEDSPAMVPSLEQLVFQENLGDVILWSRVNEVSQCLVSEGNKKVAHFLNHRVSRVPAPLCILELVFVCLDSRKLKNHVPTDPVSWN